MLRGVVEGFYGREWNWEARRSYVSFLRDMGLNAYIYCPKGDPHLRKRWREAWPAGTAAELAGLAQQFREHGLSWGVGLSPFALYEDYSPAARRALQQRVAQLRDLGGNILAILFDDMPGDIADLAARQGEIVADVRAWSDAEHLLVCPTYYSPDPVLEQHFGTRPPAYWRDLGEVLPEDVGIFWTGNEVCSRTIHGDDLRSITSDLRRRPVLWDNYPVNDGARACRFLHLSPLPGRSGDLPGAVSGHFCNPMNQAWLSHYPLSGLATLYGAAPVSLEDLFPADLAGLLGRDAGLFQDGGLDALGAAETETLCREYGRLDHPAAGEVVAWLRGEYAFDPACLTG
jgi:hypothetical protein